MSRAGAGQEHGRSRAEMSRAEQGRKRARAEQALGMNRIRGWKKQDRSGAG